MSTRSFERERRGAVWEIEALRLLHKPVNFDEWVCLGGDYRDQAEVQEFASFDEAQELSLAFSAFQKKLKYTAMVEEADAAQSRQWFRSAQRVVAPQGEVGIKDGGEDEERAATPPEEVNADSV